MDGILKVTPQSLISTANSFNATGAQVKGLTQEMLQIVKAMNSIWQGEAATAYSAKFGALQDDMERIDRMIAQRYQQAEQKNTEESSALQDDIIQ